MTAANPYETPSSDLAEAKTSFYDPAFFSLSGRIGRLRYFGYNAGAYLLFILAVGVFSVLLGAIGAGSGVAFGLIVAIPTIAFVVLSLGYTRRRLNDLEKNGWLMLLMFVPVVNIFFSLYLLFWPGSKTENQYGPAPRGSGSWWLAVIAGLVMVAGILAAVAIPAYQDYVTRAQIQSQ